MGDLYLDPEEERIFAVCCGGAVIIFYGSFIMMFLVGIIQFLLGM